MLWSVNTSVLVFAKWGWGEGWDTSHTTQCISSASRRVVQTLSTLTADTVASYTFISVTVIFTFLLHFYKLLQWQIQTLTFACPLSIQMKFTHILKIWKIQTMLPLSCYSFPLLSSFKKCDHNHCGLKPKGALNQDMWESQLYVNLNLSFA
jgi:hypothetical protein